MDPLFLIDHLKYQNVWEVMIKLTTLISSNNGLMENSRLSRFSTKGQLVCKNRLKTSFLKSQFQNPRNLGEKNCFFTRKHKNNFQFTTEQKID